MQIKIQQFVGIKGLNISMKKYQILIIHELFRVYKFKGTKGIIKEFLKLIFVNEESWTSKSGYHKTVILLGLMITIQPIKYT